MSMTTRQAKQLGALIAKTRAKRGLSLQALADQLGVPKSWVGHLELGRFLEPAPERLARIATALDIDPARIDRVSNGAMTANLPDSRSYFRAKYALTPEQVDKIERYVERLRRAA